jgi:hypothetical protein
VILGGGLEQCVDVRDGADPRRSPGAAAFLLRAYTTADADFWDAGNVTTRLEKTLKREIIVDGRAFVVAVSPEGLKLTLKGKRKGQELHWSDLVSGDAALAAALNASVGQFEAPAAKPAPAPAAAHAPKPRAAPSPQPTKRGAPPPKKRATPTERARGDARAQRRSDDPSRSKRR